VVTELFLEVDKHTNASEGWAGNAVLRPAQALFNGASEGRRGDACDGWLACSQQFFTIPNHGTPHFTISINQPTCISSAQQGISSSVYRLSPAGLAPHRYQPRCTLSHHPKPCVQRASLTTGYVCRRPGILVLINDADWELEGEASYALQSRDNVLFVSTLHGG
jgi:hypothetical protein